MADYQVVIDALADRSREIDAVFAAQRADATAKQHEADRLILEEDDDEQGDGEGAE